MLTSLVICKKLLKIAIDKKTEINIILNIKKSDVAEASLLDEINTEKSKKESEEVKKNNKKEKEREKKRIRKIKKTEEELIPRELKLMGEEDTRLYYDKMSYILAEKKIEELLSELLSLKEKEKMDLRTIHRVERIIYRRERERRERDEFKMIISLDDDDYKDVDNILEEDLRRELEKDDDILIQLEEIYEQQKRILKK